MRRDILMQKDCKSLFSDSSSTHISNVICEWIILDSNASSNSDLDRMIKDDIENELGAVHSNFDF